MPRDDLFSLPFAGFLKIALQESSDWQPDPKNWTSPMFEFTRWIKGHPSCADLDGYEAAEVVESALAQLTGDDDDPWEARFCYSDDPRAEFIATWDKVRTPANMDALEVAWRDAQRVPLTPCKRYSRKYCQLVSLAGHLQRPRPDQPIALPVVRIAALLVCDRTLISTYLRFAVTERILRKSSEYVPHKRAAEYWFDLGRFNWKTGLEADE